MVQACIRHQRIGSKRPVPLFLPCQLCPGTLGELQGTIQLPRSCRDPKKRQPQNSLGCRNRNSPLHMRTAIYEWPRGTTRAHCACAVPVALWGTEAERGVPWSREEEKPVSLRRPLSAGLLVPYLIVLHGSLTRPLRRRLPLPSTCAPQEHSPSTRSRPQRETNLGSASAPPLPVVRAPTANQRAGRSPSTPPREAGLE